MVNSLPPPCLLSAGRLAIFSLPLPPPPLHPHASFSISCLLLVSCLLSSPVCYSPCCSISCLVSRVSCLVSRVLCLVSRVSCLLFSPPRAFFTYYLLLQISEKNFSFIMLGTTERSTLSLKHMSTSKKKARVHVPMFPHVHVSMFPRAHVPTCPRAYVPAFPRAHVPACPRPNNTYMVELVTMDSKMVSTSRGAFSEMHSKKRSE